MLPRFPLQPAVVRLRPCLHCFLLLALAALPLTLPAQSQSPSLASKAIPWSQLSAEARQQGTADHIAIEPAADGSSARLRAAFQKLEGHATAAGLWLESTEAPGKHPAESFRILATALANTGAVDRALPLDRTGQVTATPELVTFTRPQVVEEYSVSLDGVRQDFIVLRQPAGSGRLRLDLAVDGALASATPGGARLVLPQSQRAIAYSRLHVTDATGRVLSAHLEVTSPERLSVQVDDTAATYPVRIDPTFSDDDWSEFGGGANGYVYALALIGTDLYVGGDFSSVGEVPAANIAKWNGSTWTALATSMSQYAIVTGLAVFDNVLYVGGSFTLIDGVPAKSVATWNGSTWAALGGGVSGQGNNPANDGVVYKLVKVGTDLYVAGSFDTAGGQSAVNIARWNGSTWSALGSSVDSTVLTLAVQGSDLYVGGWFNTAGGVAGTNNVARWDGSAWHSVGGGVTGNGLIYCLAFFGPDLYMGGSLYDNGVSTGTMSRWDGSAWHAANTGLGTLPQNMVAMDNVLYVCGTAAAGGSSVSRWDGSVWSPLGTGTNAPTFDMLKVGSSLYVGGYFTEAGGRPANHLAVATLSGSISSLDLTGQSVDEIQPAGTTVGTVSGTIAENGPPGPLTFALPAGVLDNASFTLDGNTLKTAAPFNFEARASYTIQLRATIPGLPDEIREKFFTIQVNDIEEVPELAVELASTEITDGGFADFGSVGKVNGAGLLHFTLKNTGNGDLSIQDITKTGVHEAMFSIVGPPPVVVPPFSSATLTLQCTPTTSGLKTAVLHVLSNDDDEGAYDITLLATGVTAAPPAVTTLAASALTFSTAMLKGAANAKGAERAVVFEYGPTTSYGSLATATPVSVSGSTTTAFSATVTGLLPHKTYHYRARAASAQGSANGKDVAFTTANHPPAGSADAYVALPSAKITLPVLINDQDVDEDSLSVHSFTQPPAAAGKVAKAGSDLVFTPAATFAGGVTFTYITSDAFGGRSTPVTVSLGLAECALGANVSVPSDSPPYELSVTATAPWAVIESLPWLSFTPPAPGASAVQFILAPNPSLLDRTGTVKIGGKTHSVTQKGVAAVPVLTVPSLLPNPMISGTYDLAIPTQNGPVTYTVTGLPKGLTLSNTTGHITGTPTVVGTSTVIVLAKNAKGTSSPISFELTVLPFPDSLVGNYSGALNPTGLTDLGGLMTMSVTNVGTVTGTLKLGPASHPFTARLNTTLDPESAVPHLPTLHVRVARTGKKPVIMNVYMHPSGFMDADYVVADAPSFPSNFFVGKHVWNATSNPASQYDGQFTASLQCYEYADVVAPQGNGFLTFTVSPAGSVTWSGELPDGTIIKPVIASLWVNGQVPLFAPLYNGKGSLSQTITIGTSNRLVSGSPWWRKLPQPASVRAYAAGFTVGMLVDGGIYVPPVAGKTLLNITPPGTPQIQFDLGTIEATSQFTLLDQFFTVSAAHVATFSASPTTNPAQIKLTKIDVANGTFTGTMSLQDDNPFNAALPQVARTVNFSGVLLPHLNQGTGYFLLPAISGPPAKVTTSPLTSGRVRINP